MRSEKTTKIKEKRLPTTKMFTSDVTLEKLPPLHKEDKIAQDFFSTRDRKRMTNDLNDWDQDYSLYKHWQNPDSVHRRLDSEKDNDISVTKSKKDMPFPLKPVLHKRAFRLNNCKTGDDYFMQKDQNTIVPDYLELDGRRGKQASNRRQVNMYQSKPEPFDTESHQPSRRRGEANSKSTNGYQTLCEDQHGIPKSQNSLKKETQRQEIILQEKLMRTVEKLRNKQPRATSEYKDKTELKNENMEKAEKQLYFTEKGHWDREIGREKAVAGRRRDEGQRERPRDWERGVRDDRERREKHEIERGEFYGERRREEIERENRRRNAQTTSDYKYMSNEGDNREVRTTHKWETVRLEKDKIQRERVVEWGMNEKNEGDRRDWQEREYDDRERKWERVESKRDVENKYQKKQWNVLDAFVSNTHVKEKASSRHDQTNLLMSHEQPVQVGLQQPHSQRLVEEAMCSFREGPPKEPPTEETEAKSPPPNQMTTKLQQVEPSPEMCFDAPARLAPCKVCHRNFAEDRLERHVSVCEKLQHSKRKIFDSSKSRIKGTEMEGFMKKNIQCKTPEPWKNNWHQKNKALSRNPRQANAPAPRGFPPRPSADVNPDYVSCPHCTRRFAPDSAERHIPKCQNIKSKPPPTRHRQ